MSIPLKTDTRESYIARQKAEHLYWAQANFDVNGKDNFAAWCSLWEWAMAEDTYGEHWDKLNGVELQTIAHPQGEPAPDDLNAESLETVELETVDEGGFLDNIPIYNIARDEAWGNFISRKYVKHFAKHGLFAKGFPLYGGYYELWCQAWDRAWTDGHKEGWDSGYKFGHDVVSLASSSEGLKPREKK